MRRVSTKTTKVLAYLENNPSAKPADVAKKFKMAVQYVYKLRGYTKENKMPSTLVPNAQMSLALFSDSQKKEVVDRVAHMEKVFKKNDNVNSPAHYTTGGIETIDFIEAKSLNYNLGNVVKYVSRSDYKGKKLEDLKKARWYLCREINNLSK
jgi:hypothetical protein